MERKKRADNATVQARLIIQSWSSPVATNSTPAAQAVPPTPTMSSGSRYVSAISPL